MKIFPVAVFIIAAIIFTTALSGYLANGPQQAAVTTSIQPALTNSAVFASRDAQSVNTGSTLPAGCSSKEGYSSVNGVACDTYFPATPLAKFTEKDLPTVDTCRANYSQCLIDAKDAKDRCLRNPDIFPFVCQDQAINALRKCTNEFLQCLWPEQYPGGGPFSTY